MVDEGRARESETDMVKPDAPGLAPRPATEPDGSKGSTQTDKTATDPGSGAPSPAGDALRR
jgi:hypothetical protein